MSLVYKEFSAKSVEEAITEATVQLGVTSSDLVYEVVDKGSHGFLGIGSRPAVIKVQIGEKKEEKISKPILEPMTQRVEKKVEVAKVDKVELKEEKVREVKNLEPVSEEELVKRAVNFLVEVTKKMGIEASIDVSFDSEFRLLEINMSGQDMGLLIGKRGQTLDSLQYLVSLVVNKNIDQFVRVNLDTENYRARRKETLENFAHNIASKVKKTGKDVTLEPMNPNERRVIHAALQNDHRIKTFSVGKDPYRKIVVSLNR